MHPSGKALARSTAPSRGSCPPPVEMRGAREEGGGGACASLLCMAVVCPTVDPRTSTMPGRSIPGFHRPGKHCLHPSARGERGGGYSFVACLSILTIDHAPLLRRSTGGGGGQGTQFVHGRSRMTIDPRIPTVSGRSRSGFHQPGRHCLRRARSAVRCSANRMKGELHPSKNRS